MKKKLSFIARLFIAVLAVTATFAVTTAYAVENNSSNAATYKVSDAVSLVKFLTCQSTDIDMALDIDKNGKINAIDLTLLKRILISELPGSSETETTTTTTETTTETTTTTTETTTETTTTTTETTTTLPDNKYFSQEVVQKNCTYAHSNIPSDQLLNTYYQLKGTYFFKDTAGNVWCYNLMTTEQMSDFQAISDYSNIKRLHIWKPSDELLQQYLEKWGLDDVQDPYTDKTPSNEGLWKDASGNTGNYNLRVWKVLQAVELDRVAKVLAKETPMDNFTILARYDYNKDNDVTFDELMLMTHYFMAKLPRELGIEEVPTDAENYFVNPAIPTFKVVT